MVPMMMSNNQLVMRGDIFFVDLDPTIGREQAKKRPCLIISVHAFNNGPAGLCVILPITSRQRSLSWFVKINLGTKHDPKPSYIICNQPRTVSRERLIGRPVGKVSPLVMQNVEERLRILLSL
jgi:mRNA interferase MazF